MAIEEAYVSLAIARNEAEEWSNHTGVIRYGWVGSSVLWNGSKGMIRYVQGYGRVGARYGRVGSRIW